MLKKIISKLKKIANLESNLETGIYYRIVTDRLQNQSLTSVNSIIDPIIKNDKELIVTLTTYNKRIYDVHLVIETIAQQTFKPNRVILWLDQDEFSLNSLPLILHRQIKRGLEIRFCEDLKSYKKLIPTLKLFPNADLLTIDDDILYPYDMIELMKKESLEFSDCVIANMVHEIKFESGTTLPYKKWDLYSSADDKGDNIFPVGAGGVFYPANVLHIDCVDVKTFTELAPHADDVWFKAMTLLNGNKSKKINDKREIKNRFLAIASSQDIGLFHSNLINSGNDPQISNVFKRYNIFQ